MKKTGKYLTLLVLALVLVIGAQFLLSCEKDPIHSGSEELQPTLTVSKIPTGVLPYGDTIKISWTTTNTRFLTINGKNQWPVEQGCILIYPVTKDTLIEARATNTTLYKEAEVEVHVGDWKTSRLGIISHDHWHMTANKRFRDNALLVSYQLSEIEKNEEYFFTIDGKYKVIRSGNQIGSDVWTFSSDKSRLSIGSNPPETFSFSYFGEEKMVMTRTVTYADGLPCISELTFERK